MTYSKAASAKNLVIEMFIIYRIKYIYTLDSGKCGNGRLQGSDLNLPRRRVPSQVLETWWRMNPPALRCKSLSPHEQFRPPWLQTKKKNHDRADSRFAPNQWETVLLCNDVSKWLGTSLGSALHNIWVHCKHTVKALSFGWCVFDFEYKLFKYVVMITFANICGAIALMWMVLDSNDEKATLV